MSISSHMITICSIIIELLKIIIIITGTVLIILIMLILHWDKWINIINLQIITAVEDILEFNSSSNKYF